MHFHKDPGSDLVLEDRVIQGILETLNSPHPRYDCGKMSTVVIAQVLMQYLTRTIRRSAAYQATVVDTHDSVVSGETIIPPLTLIDYMVMQVLISARKNRSARDILPLRVFDPACGSGMVLLAVYRHLLEEAGGSTLTFEERQEILAHSVYGLDINRHAVAVTRMLLFLELCDCRYDGPAEGEFLDTVQTVLRDLRHTILCGNALVGPGIVNDEAWMFCPARDRHTINPFSLRDRFPEIVTGGWFDAVVCNPPEGALEQREWIQQYFQQRYSVFHPLVDRSAYFLEKSLSLLRPGGVVSCVMRNRWLRGSNGSPLREVINTRQIEEIVDLSAVPVGKPGGMLCCIRVRNTLPSHPFPDRKSVV
jgi:SAM-dependent methyltransferase